MPHYRPLTVQNPAEAGISLDEAQGYITLFRSILELLRQAHEILGVPLPDKGAGH